VARAGRLAFEWDAVKSNRCPRERGFSFADVQPAFADPARRVEADIRHDYGETRFRLFGRVDGRQFVIVYTCARASCVLYRHAGRMRGKGRVMVKVRARLEADGTVSIRQNGRWERVEPRTDWSGVDATTEAEIAAQIAQDDAEAAADAAAWARRVRRRVGLSQVEFARRIGVPVTTVREWERGTAAPQGTARALLRLIDRVPEAALAVLAA